MRFIIGTGLIYTLVCILLAIGWVLNCIAIAHTMNLPMTGMFVLRVAGIFVAPLGGVLGYL